MMYLLVYVVVVGAIIFLIYKATYKPPKYEKIVNRAEQKQITLLDGLKTKIDNIDTKQKAKAKLEKAKNYTTPNKKSKSVKSSSKSYSSSKSSQKSKNVRRRR